MGKKVLDYEFVQVAASQNMETILDALGLEHKLEGGWITLRCLFHHGEKFNLKFRGDSFYCFSECRKQYSIFDIVMKIKAVCFPEAVEWVANLIGVDPDEIQATSDQKEINEHLKMVRHLASITRMTKIEYHPVSVEKIGTVTTEKHPWILNQGFSEETLEYFGVGYGEEGPMRGRVTFPIDAPNGTIISLSGRMPNYEKVGLPKYFIISHSQVKNTLWNYSRIDKSLPYIIVVEGFKSVMALHQNGYHNAVATIGASIGKEQKNLLLKLGVPILVICDNDKVGEQLGQSIYNQCHLFTTVKSIKLSKITTKPKASVDDLDFEEFAELEERIKNVTN